MNLPVVIAVRDLRIWYRSPDLTPVLNGINLEIEPGEFVALQGPSGCGKSTLALALLNALPENAQRSGEVLRFGTIMAPVFQEASGALHPMLSVGRQVMEALRARRSLSRSERLRQAHAALESVGLDPHRYFDSWPHQLSGGEKQRALIAQAIVGSPDLVIADEPTASLDPVTREAIVILLRDLRTRMGLAMLWITHSALLIRDFDGRVLTMREGIVHDRAS
jgi:peptide/nickel transport system ATP-binding protein